MKITISVVAATAMLVSAPVFAGEHGCCAKGASNDKKECVSFASLSLTADQKTKLETWQSDCMKAGCTKESRSKFLKRAKGILSADEYAKVKEMCGKPGKKSEA